MVPKLKVIDYRRWETSENEVYSVNFVYKILQNYIDAEMDDFFFQ